MVDLLDIGAQSRRPDVDVAAQSRGDLGNGKGARSGSSSQHVCAGGGLSVAMRLRLTLAWGATAKVRGNVERGEEGRQVSVEVSRV